MMLLVPGKRPSFDILPHKKNTALRQGKNDGGHKVDQVEIAPMGPPWFKLGVWISASRSARANNGLEFDYLAREEISLLKT